MLAKARVRINKTFAQIGLLSVELLIVGAAFITSLIGFSYLVKEIFIDKNETFDKGVFKALEQYISPATTAFMQGITFFATHTFLIPANLLLAAYFFFIRKHKWYSIKVASIAVSSTGMMFLLKQYFGRQRPLIPLLEHARGLSFPSGHAMMSFAFYGLLIYLVHKYVKHRPLRWMLIAMLLAFIFLIGFSRIYLRVHYASDVLAGFSVGVVWLVFSITALNRIEKFSQRKIQPVDQHGNATSPMV